MSKRRVAITGGSGKLGRAVVAELDSAGWQAFNFDIAPPRDQRGSFTRINLSDLGQAIEAFQGIDELHDGVEAVVHLAAIPGATHAANTATFVNNLTATYNVFTAARIAGVQNIVWASSETLLGYPFADTRPPYVPMDENYPAQGNVAYSLAKVLEEEIARQLTRRDPLLKMYGLRFSNVIGPGEYEQFPSFDADPLSRKWNMWGYIDAHDAARAVRLALEHEGTGFEAFNIAAADTVMSRSTQSLMEEVYPEVEIRGTLGEHEGLTDIRKAREVLGWSPEHSWR